MITFMSMDNSGQLVNSKIDFFSYPGGELSFNVPDNEKPLVAIMSNSNPTGGNISEDFIKLGLWSNWCKNVGCASTLFLKYIPAARADRGVPFGLKVYASMLNACEIDRVKVMDAHSPVSLELINNVVEVNLVEIIVSNLEKNRYCGVIAPDEGAINRATTIANALGVPMYYGIKKRDFTTGKILDYSIDLNDFNGDGHLLVVDDICDGGGTFMFLASISGLPKKNLDLWVTHGIFSGRAMDLKTHFDRIITTDSVTPYNNVADVIIPTDSYMLQKVWHSPKTVKMA